MKRNKRGWVGVVVALAGVVPLSQAADVSAQGMSFSLDEVEGSEGTETTGTGTTGTGTTETATAEPPPSTQLTAPPEDGPPTEAFAAAQSKYRERRYREAAIEFQRVIDGETHDMPAQIQKAQFLLGKTLYHLRYYQAALAIFDEISLAGPYHVYYDETLQWLVQLATQLPDSAGITEKIGRYPIAQLDQFDQAAAAASGEEAEEQPRGSESSRNAFDHLLYLMGRYKYDQTEFDSAAQLFGRVRQSSPYFAEALFYQGVTFVQLRRASPAIDSFRALITGIDNGSIHTDDPERFRSLGWISLGRLYYTASRSVDANGDVSHDGRVLGQAVESWNQIEPTSEYWLDAVFESSWAFFLATEYSRALGNIHSINSPYFPNSYYPEGIVIKAVTFFANCQVENATAMIQLFHSRYDPVKQQLQAVLSRFNDTMQFFEFLKQVRDGTADIPEIIKPIVSVALGDRVLLRHLHYAELLTEEEGRLAAEPDTFRNSTVGARVAQDISLAKSFATNEAGNLTLRRFRRLVDDLEELTNQVARVQIEILTYQRGELSAEAQATQAIARATSGGNIVVDEEHQRWPFDGEYWRDELGYYRQQVTNRCRR